MHAHAGQVGEGMPLCVCATSSIRGMQVVAQAVQVAPEAAKIAGTSAEVTVHIPGEAMGVLQELHKVAGVAPEAAKIMATGADMTMTIPQPAVSNAAPACIQEAVKIVHVDVGGSSAEVAANISGDAVGVLQELQGVVEELHKRRRLQ